MVEIRKFGHILIAGGLVASLAACDDLLDVQDPSRFTDDDLDNALEAVATGVEGDLHLQIDNLNTSAALMSDEFQHTGTWAQWDDADHGRIRYDQDGQSGGGGGLLRARFAAQDATARFDRLAGEGRTIAPELRAQVEVTEGWTDLLLAQYFCEAPQGQNTVAIPDVEMYAQARDKLTAALGTATGDFELWARAGLARAELMVGNHAAASAAAGAVLGAAPAGWAKEAAYQVSTAENSIVNLATFSFNHAGGIREKWWPMVDDAARLMRDPLTNELDPRVPIRHEDGVLGVDGVTEFYSQWKYTDVGDNIPITHLDEMRLIQAEAAWATGDLPGAMTILNGLRTAEGLSPVTATTSQEVFDVLLNERFAELFMEGQRMQDLYRFDLVPAMMTAGNFVETDSPRSIKFPLSASEGLNNPNIEDDESARCTPLATAG
jgi:hypothetical protein